MQIVIIAAVAANGTIGDAGKIPWHISDDLKRFKRLTIGHPIIMGRKTYESLGKPLPGRRNIVLTRQTAIPGVECYSNLDAALAACTETIESKQGCHPEPVEGSQSLNISRASAEILRQAQNDKASTVFIIGGAEIYRLALPVADTLLLTHVHRDVPGGTKFPDYDRTQWKEIAREDHESYSFVEYHHISRHV